MTGNSAERSPAMITDMPPLTQELLDLLRTQIAAEEIKMRRAMDRTRDHREAAQIWRDFNVAVRPLHDEVKHIIRQLATIAVARMPVIVTEISAERSLLSEAGTPQQP